MPRSVRRQADAATGPSFGRELSPDRLRKARSSLTLRRLLPLGAAGTRPSPEDAGQLTDVFNVRSFGARVDGTTIDTDAINRAVAAAAVNRPGPRGGTGGTVYFPAGTYACYSIHLAEQPTASGTQRSRRSAALITPTAMITTGRGRRSKRSRPT